MKHLGDITKLNGAEIPFVDVITGGSPCQDLSIAGKRAKVRNEHLLLSQQPSYSVHCGRCGRKTHPRSRRSRACWNLSDLN